MKKFYEKKKDLTGENFDVIGRFSDTLYMFNANMLLYQRECASGKKHLEENSLIIGNIEDYDSITLGDCRSEQLKKSYNSMIPVRRIVYKHKELNVMIEEYVIMLTDENLSFINTSMTSKENLKLVEEFIGDRITDEMINSISFASRKTS